LKISKTKLKDFVLESSTFPRRSWIRGDSGRSPGFPEALACLPIPNLLGQWLWRFNHARQSLTFSGLQLRGSAGLSPDFPFNPFPGTRIPSGKERDEN